MTKTQILQLLGIAAMIGLVVFFMNARNAPQPQIAPQQAPQAGAPGAQAPAEAKPQAAAESAPASISDPVAINRDPFQLPPLLKEVLRQKLLAKQAKPAPIAVGPTQAAVQPNLKLQGIMWGTSKPRAIINRRIVEVGDTIEDATIIAVGKNGVTVSFGGQEYVLKLPTKGGAGGGGQVGWPSPGGQQGQSF